MQHNLTISLIFWQAPLYSAFWGEPCSIYMYMYMYMYIGNRMYNYMYMYMYVRIYMYYTQWHKVAYSYEQYKAAGMEKEAWVRLVVVCTTMSVQVFPI